MMFNLFKSLDEKIEADVNQLIKGLKSSDIRTLILEMSNNLPISKNVIKKQKRNKSYSSSDSTSWFAYKISNDIKDVSLKPKLIGLLNEKDFILHRGSVLRCLSSLCVNTNDYELFDFLISQLKQIGDEEIITTVLNRLEKLKKPKSVNIEYLKELLLEGTYQNKIDALSALSNCEHSELEDILIHQFKTNRQHIKCMICATLRSVGKIKSRDFLMLEVKKARGSDLKYFIQSALDDINKNNDY